MKKTLNILKNVVTVAVVIAAVAMMIFTIVSVTTFDRNDRSLFGYKAYIVRSDSMSKTDFDAGDLVLVKNVDPTTLKEGDIISYQSTNPENYGETVTHKIRTLTTDAEGNRGFVTYGTTTETDDANIVTYPYVLGKYEFAIPKVGAFFTFLKTTPGYIICIFLPFLLLIVMQGISGIKLFKKYKSEQLAEIEEKRQKEREELEAQREELEKQRKRQEELMAELIKMKAELSGAKSEE